jgi:hypothetical protein
MNDLKIDVYHLKSTIGITAKFELMIDLSLHHFLDEMAKETSFEMKSIGKFFTSNFFQFSDCVKFIIYSKSFGIFFNG